MTANIAVYCDPKLKQLASDEADRLNISLSELVVRALADYLGAPAELAEVPRSKMGRPRNPISIVRT